LELSTLLFVFKTSKGNSMKTLCINAGLSLSSDAPREYVLEEACKLVAETVKEPGCQHFELLERQDDPTKFTLWERWDSEEDLNNRFGSSRTKADCPVGRVQTSWRAPCLTLN
jgi:quinol monooxygenase YgiN